MQYIYRFFYLYICYLVFLFMYLYINLIIYIHTFIYPEIYLFFHASYYSSSICPSILLFIHLYIFKLHLSRELETSVIGGQSSPSSSRSSSPLLKSGMCPLAEPLSGIRIRHTQFYLKCLS